MCWIFYNRVGAGITNINVTRRQLFRSELPRAFTGQQTNKTIVKCQTAVRSFLPPSQTQAETKVWILTVPLHLCQFEIFLAIATTLSFNKIKNHLENQSSEKSTNGKLARKEIAINTSPFKKSPSSLTMEVKRNGKKTFLNFQNAGQDLSSRSLGIGEERSKNTYVLVE